MAKGSSTDTRVSACSLPFAHGTEAWWSVKMPSPAPVDNYVSYCPSPRCKARLNAVVATLPDSAAMPKYPIKSMLYANLRGFQQGHTLTCHRFVIFVHNWRGGATDLRFVKSNLPRSALSGCARNCYQQLRIAQRLHQHVHQRRIGVRRDAVAEIGHIAVMRVESGQRFSQLATNGRLVGGQQQRVKIAL